MVSDSTHTQHKKCPSRTTHAFVQSCHHGHSNHESPKKAIQLKGSVQQQQQWHKALGQSEHQIHRNRPWTCSREQQPAFAFLVAPIRACALTG